jgi:atypical dual specificity phosphatase
MDKDIPDVSSDESETDQVDDLEDTPNDGTPSIEKIDDLDKKDENAGKDAIDELDFEVVDGHNKKKLSQKAQYHLNFWKTVTKYNTVIKGTNILPMKTPLMRYKWIDNLQADQQFNLVEFVKNFEHEGKKIGVVIDLNFSDGGYYTWDICQRKNKDILGKKEYFKIKIEHGQIPNKKTCNRVFDILNKNLYKDHIVAIHCTYGINRTGYLVCDFLCKKLKMKPSESIQAFSDARGYPLTKKILVEDLYDNYDEKEFQGRDPYNKK